MWLGWLPRFGRRRLRPETLGRRGERYAARYLRRKGYRILAAQVRLPAGELDLVALDGRVIVFVEVKTRSAALQESPAEAVDERKQRRITQAALAFLRRHDLLGHPARFDIIAIVWPPRGKPQLQHYPAAFESTSNGLW